MRRSNAGVVKLGPVMFEFEIQKTLVFDSGDTLHVKAFPCEYKLNVEGPVLTKMRPRRVEEYEPRGGRMRGTLATAKEQRDPARLARSTASIWHKLGSLCTVSECLSDHISLFQAWSRH